MMQKDAKKLYSQQRYKNMTICSISVTYKLGNGDHERLFFVCVHGFGVEDRGGKKFS